MNKAYVILPLLMIGGCAQLTGDAYDDEYYEEETGLYVEERQPVAQLQPQMPARPMTQSQSQPQMQQPRISADGTMIELPAQQIYLSDVAGGGQVPPVATPVRGPAIAYSMPASAEVSGQPNAYQPRPQQPAMVTLQNVAYPNTYAQCMVGDTACVVSYEQQGYRQIQGLPQFAGYRDVLAPSDYPQNGRWRNGNNIPRW